MARVKLTKKSIEKTTPISNTIEMKNQYVPMPKITPEARKKAIESRLVSGAVSVTKELVNLPCGPIPDCNTIKVEQIVGLENNSLVYSEPNSTDGGLTHTSVDGTVTFIKLSHTELVNTTANTPLTITHNLNSTRIQVVAYDVATGEQVDVEVKNRTANSVDIISTTADALDIVIKK